MTFLKGMRLLGFSNLPYLPQIAQYNFFIILVIENILILFYHSSDNY